jgi:hypothetical protein
MIFSDATTVMRSAITSRLFTGPFIRFQTAWRVICTFSIVSLTWIFFRAPDMSTAWYMISHLGSNIGPFLNSLTSIAGIRETVLMGTTLSALECVPIGIAAIFVLETVDYLRAHGRIHVVQNRIPRAARIGLYGMCVCAILIFGQFATSIPFIYFQF